MLRNLKILSANDTVADGSTGGSNSRESNSRAIVVIVGQSVAVAGYGRASGLLGYQCVSFVFLFSFFLCVVVRLYGPIIVW